MFYQQYRENINETLDRIFKQESSKIEAAGAMLAGTLEQKGLLYVFGCGHSHMLKVMWDEKYQMLTINPGAEGIQGWHLVRTALRFRIENGNVKDMEVFELPRSGHQQ